MQICACAWTKKMWKIRASPPGLWAAGSLGRGPALSKTQKQRRRRGAYVCYDLRYQLTPNILTMLQMNPLHLQQFLPNLHNWTSVNELFQAQLASWKRMEIWQTLRLTNKLWNEHFQRKIIHNLREGQHINTHFRFMGNGCRYVHRHYAIAFIVNSIHVFSHLRPKSAIKCTTRL